MNATDATVTAVSVRRDLATVVLEPGVACARCAAGRGCGAGLFGRRDRSISLAIDATVASGLRPGDRVAVELDDGDLLKAAGLAYGIPLFAAVAAAAMASLLFTAEAAAVLGALAGLAGGVLYARRRAAAMPCGTRLVAPGNGDDRVSMPG